MKSLVELRREARDVCFAMADDPAETAQEYLTQMQPVVLALFAAHLLTIIVDLAILDDYTVGDFSGTSR